MKKNSIATLLFITTLALTLLTFGCDSQGPAEKAGEKVDTTVESTKDAAGVAAEKVGESIDETGGKMKESTKPKN